jgi:hypothetical protein
VNIDTSGRVSARVAGFPDTPLNRCVDAALRHTPVAVPREPISVTHTFSLRAAATQPVISMLHALVLLFALALEPAPSALSPEAAEHNTKAMVFYDAGQLGPAFDEFHAAYTSMPDARRDRAGREILLGSMHAACSSCTRRAVKQRRCVAFKRSSRSTWIP